MIIWDSDFNPLTDSEMSIRRSPVVVVSCLRLPRARIVVAWRDPDVYSCEDMNV